MGSSGAKTSVRKGEFRGIGLDLRLEEFDDDVHKAAKTV